jgi:hypothetical protein
MKPFTRKNKFVIVLAVTSLAFMISGCSGSKSESIKTTSYYETVQEVWDSLDASNKATVCSFDGENIDGAYGLIKIGLKFDYDINIEENSEKWDEAIKVLIDEKC